MATCVGQFDLPIGANRAIGANRGCAHRRSAPRAPLQLTIAAPIPAALAASAFTSAVRDTPSIIPTAPLATAALVSAAFATASATTLL